MSEKPTYEELAKRVQELEKAESERRQAEEALRESKVHFREAQQIAKMGDFSWDVETGAVTWSDALFNLLGYDQSESIDYAKVNAKIHHPEDLKRVTEWLNECIASGKNVLTPNEYRIIRKNGEVIQVRTEGVIDRRDGKSARVFATVQDITERKKQEKEYKQLIDGMNDTAFIIDFNGKFIEVNETAVRTLGYSREELLSLGPVDIDPYLSPDKIEKLIEGMKKDEKQVFETRHKTKKGEIIPVEISSSPVTYQGKHVILSVARDITERKRAEEKLITYQKRFEDIAHSSGDWIWEVDANAKYTFASGRVKEILGYNSEDLIGKTPFDFMPEEEAKRVREIFIDIVAARKAIVDLENKNLSKTGDVVYLLTNGLPLIDAGGILQGYRGVDKDITKRKQAEDALRESENKFKAIFEGSHDAITLTSEEGKVIDCNQSALQLFGLKSKKDFGNKRPADFSPPMQTDGRESQALSRRYIEQVIETGKPKRFEWLHQRTTGEVIPTEIIFTSYSLKDKKVLHASIRDISDRKQAEKSLKESEAKFRNLFQDHSAVKLIIDPVNGNIVDANESAAIFYGWPMDVLKTMKISQINTLSPDEVKQELEKARSMRKIHFEFKHRKADGRIVDVEVFSSKVSIGGKEYLHSIIHDISEKRRLEDQLIQAQKMESVGRLAGGVAHDFNNMLGVILGRTEMMHMGMQPQDPYYEDLEEIQKAAMRSADLTRQLLAFARKQTIIPKVLNLNETVEGMLKMLRRLIGEDIRLAWKSDANLWPVRMDPSQVDQILANLCANARGAIAGKGNITIETKNVVLDKLFCAAYNEAQPGQYVMLAVNDDGCGMDETIRSQIFEPFFTTRDIGEGTGLGLSTVYGIVKQNEGFISVYSEVGKGTAIKIYVPKYEGSVIKETNAGFHRNSKRPWRNGSFSGG